MARKLKVTSRRAAVVCTVLLVFALWFFDRAGRDAEISRIVILETPYSLLVTKDFKRMHHYQVLEVGEPVSEPRLLTGPMVEDLAGEVVERTGSRVIVRWPVYSEYVEIDLARGVLSDSTNNPSAPLLRR